MRVKALLDLAIEHERFRDALTILRGMTGIPAPIVGGASLPRLWEGHPCPDTRRENIMDTIKDFEFKRRKYMPVFPKARGKPTVYIPGYPYEDEQPMPASEYHGVQINTFYEQLARYFEINELIHVGLDTFIYYREGEPDKSVAPDVYVVFGVDRMTLRKSFYTWEEGAVPSVVFEFLSDSTANQDRHEKVRLYLIDMGVEEYFIHQPTMTEPPEFCGWRRDPSGDIVEMASDEQGGLLSRSLNLWFRWEEQRNGVRLLRPYLPDGTPITTSMEEHHLRLEAQEIAAEAEARAVEAQEIAAEEAERRREEAQRRREAETLATEEAERRREEAQRRQEAEKLATEEAERRREEAQRRQEAEKLATEEAERRREAEAELERLRAQLANREDEGA